MRGRYRRAEQAFQKIARPLDHGRHHAGIAIPASSTHWQAAGLVTILTARACAVLKGPLMTMDEQTRIELEAAVYRRLVEHLRSRTDVQNIDLMNLAGFCRNCLSNWMKEAADAKGLPMSKDDSREVVYGMPFDEWKAKYQKDASPDQKAAFDKGSHRH
jgi:hypothetical protein